MITTISTTNSYKTQTSFKAKIIPTEGQAKLFYREYPLLGKFIPQHCYGFLGYDNTEFTRYMLTTGCSVCSRLSMYDKIKKIGFFAHVDSDKRLLESLSDIKEEIFKRKINPKNLVGIDTPGHFAPERDSPETIKTFFLQLGLKEKNIHQPEISGNAFDGGVLDLKDGELYDINTWAYDYNGYKIRLQKAIETSLDDLPAEKEKAMNELETHYGRSRPIFGKYTKV